jgi:hypothetical protein
VGLPDASAQKEPDPLESIGYKAVPIERMKCGLYRVGARVGSADVSLLLDTGSAQTRLDRKRCLHINLPWRRALFVAEPGAVYLHSGTPYVLGADTPVKIGDVPALHGAIYEHDLSASNKKLAMHGDEPIDGLLGADILNAHLCIIDLRRSRLYLARGHEKADGKAKGGG